jgi:ABC-type polysaccharide/polyol phosphate transport system ATPase subunit
MLLRDNLERLAARARGNDLAYWRWVLRDVNLDVDPGESIGLIGANGSGKSTLLKMLTRVMFPYAGSLEVSGRVGALIEVRAGIHPDLTGRENVYLFGSLLGLKRREVAKRFDAIVDFAELDNAIDRQVKYYSSGMQMRLGFAVAAFLEPDILLVDEVLAVGDALFQQKCLDRMRTVLQQGTTLILVSHDLPSVGSVCDRGVWLDRGVIQVDGTAKEAISAYRENIEAEVESHQSADEPVRLLKVDVRPKDDGTWVANGLTTQRPATIELTCASDHSGPGHVHLGVSEGTASPIFSFRKEVRLSGTDETWTCTIDQLPLPRGRFVLWAGVFDDLGNALMAWRPVTQFDVLGPDLDPPPLAVVIASPVHVGHSWE